MVEFLRRRLCALLPRYIHHIHQQHYTRLRKDNIQHYTSDSAGRNAAEQSTVVYLFRFLRSFLPSFLPDQYTASSPSMILRPSPQPLSSSFPSFVRIRQWTPIWPKNQPARMTSSPTQEHIEFLAFQTTRTVQVLGTRETPHSHRQIRQIQLTSRYLQDDSCPTDLQSEFPPDFQLDPDT